MTLGEIIKEYRAEHSLSQEAFAELAGLSKGYVSMLENNRNPGSGRPITPTLSVVERSARAMGTGTDDLIRRMDGAPAEDDLPDIAMIGRASRRLSPDQRADLIKIMKIAFPEAFDHDGQP